MKNLIWASALLLMASGFVLTSCDSPAQKVENAEANVVDAKEELAEAQREYQEDVAKFRQQTSERIESNNRNIADFNARNEADKRKARSDYKVKIAELDRKNNDLRLKLDGYRAESRDNWESFKTEFNRDMDQLSDDLNNLTVRTN